MPDTAEIDSLIERAEKRELATLKEMAGWKSGYRWRPKSSEKLVALGLAKIISDAGKPYHVATTKGYALLRALRARGTE